MTTTAMRPPAIETDLARSYQLPACPPDDVQALIEDSGDRRIWERSRIDPHLWIHAASNTVVGWTALVARGKSLREYYLDGEVWVVRADGKLPWEIYGIYSNEPAAIAAAGGAGDRRAQPCIVRHTAHEDGPDGPDA